MVGCPFYSEGRGNMHPHKVEKWFISLGGSSFVGTRSPKGEARPYPHEQATSFLPTKLPDLEDSFPFLKTFQKWTCTGMNSIPMPIGTAPVLI